MGYYFDGQDGADSEIEIVDDPSYGLNALRADVSEIQDLPVLAATVNRLAHIDDLTPRTIDRVHRSRRCGRCHSAARRECAS